MSTPPTAPEPASATVPEPVSETDAPPTGRIGRSLGVLLVQGLNSIATVVQMALFAITLPRGDFDDYSVWVTSGMFVIGIGQAIGTERVVIGKRTQDDGTRSARVLGLVIALVQLGVAAWLGNVVLMVASVAVFAYVTYDFQRFARCFDEATRFLRCDLTVIAVQVVAIGGLWLALGDRGWFALVWWGVGAPAWLLLSGRARGGLRAGLRVLRDDGRECLPLFVDAALAGLPLVVALALAQAQGSVGDASAARMAFTILGPITVLGMSARRVVYQEVARGTLTTRFAAIWAGVCLATLALCAGLLALTRTPLYPWVFPGFEGLAWLAILGFAVNHAAMFSTLLPAASLRAERRALAVGVARVGSTAAGLLAAVVLLPFDSPAKVAWCVAIGSIVYTLSLAIARLVLPRRPTEQPAGGPA